MKADFHGKKPTLSKSSRPQSDPLCERSNKVQVDRKSRSTESFYGRRKTQKLKTRKQQLVDTLLPKLRLDLNLPQPGGLDALFARPMAAYCMEIGFGGGEHLVTAAEKNPNTGFVGIEPFINGMAKMLGEIDDRQLKNVRLFDDDATLVLDWLPANCLDRLDLLYPDPWPKKRHWKRRFVSAKNLDRIARVLKPGGEFRFASDIDTYVNWTLAHCRNHPDLEWTAKSADDWHQPWPNWHRTRYEAKAIREARVPAYLIFRKL